MEDEPPAGEIPEEELPVERGAAVNSGASAVAVSLSGRAAGGPAGASADGKVVLGAAAVVDEDLISLGDLAEAVGGLIFNRLRRQAVAIGVKFEGATPERLLDLLLAGSSPDPQRLVVIHAPPNSFFPPGFTEQRYSGVRASPVNVADLCT